MIRNKKNLLKKLKLKLNETENIEIENKHLNEINEEINIHFESLKEKLENLERENYELRERLQSMSEIEDLLLKFEKNYDEILDKLQSGFYDGISDQILKQQNKILRYKLRKYENDTQNNDTNTLLMGKVINICCDIIGKK